MREIKFRLRDPGTRLIVGYERIHPEYSCWESCTDGINWEPGVSSAEYDREQYTGLKDKNGTDIYEGDVIEEMMWVKWCDVQGGFQAHMSGYGGNDCMACGGDIYWWEIVSDPQTYEVIGNIYENPELLKEV